MKLFIRNLRMKNQTKIKLIKEILWTITMLNKTKDQRERIKSIKIKNI